MSATLSRYKIIASHAHTIMPTDRRDVAALSLDDVTLVKEAYEADLAVNERAQVFATEIVRLGLLAIAGIGFMLAHPPREQAPGFTPAWLLWTTVMALGISVGAALLHRYFSTDCVVCQIAILRLIKRTSQPDVAPEKGDILRRSLSDRRDRQKRDMDWCRRLTLVAAIALGVGAISLATMVAATYAA